MKRFFNDYCSALVIALLAVILGVVSMNQVITDPLATAHPIVAFILSGAIFLIGSGVLWGLLYEYITYYRGQENQHERT